MWVNRSASNEPRSAGATTHTYNFTPATAGRLLVAICMGSVTTAWPAGWTEQLTPVGNTEISVATKTATSGESSVVVTHNAANYQVEIEVYEFASGSTWVNGIGATAQAVTAGASPTVTGLPGTAVTVFYACCYAKGVAQTIVESVTWSAPVIELTDLDVPYSTTDGNHYTVAYEDGVTATSRTATPTYSNTTTGSVVLSGERVTFAINAAALLGPPTVDALGDRYLYLGATLDRTAIVAANGATVTAQGWSLISGTGSPATLSSSTDLSWAPTVAGTYGLRYSATNSQGTTTQDITVTVVDGVWHKDAMYDMYSEGRF